MDAAIAVSHPRCADVFDLGFDGGLIVPTRLVVVGGRIDFQNTACAPDRDVPVTTHRVDQLALASRP
jgi:hypothetical protein